jgi:heme/copper-type cytochrome/quinol oxidase subunit 1
MPFMERFRHKFSALVLWCTFLALYLGGAALLVIGLVIASRRWWALIHHHANAWLIGTKTVEVLVLAVGLVLILIVPLLQRQANGRSEAWRAERRSEMKSRLPVVE